MKLKLVSHPNGFLQVGDNSGDGQYNIFTSDCPRQKVGTRIHNHAHGFTSTILTGSLLQRTYTFYKHERGKYYLCRVVPTESADTKLFVDRALRGHLKLVEQRIFQVGDINILEPGMFHEITPLGFTVTWFVKTPRLDIPVFAAVKVKERPDNSYQRFDFEHDTERRDA